MAAWKTLASEYLWQSQWYNLRQDRLRTPNGHEFTYTIVDHPGAVWIVPVTPDRQVVLIWSYRYAVDDWCYEVPAGGLGSAGDPEEVARRELLEEVGGKAAELHFVGQFYTSNGISNEVAPGCHTFGMTSDEARTNIAKAMEVHVEGMLEDGEPMPVEREPLCTARPTVVVAARVPGFRATALGPIWATYE